MWEGGPLRGGLEGGLGRAGGGAGARRKLGRGQDGSLYCKCAACRSSPCPPAGLRSPLPLAPPPPVPPPAPQVQVAAQAAGGATRGVEHLPAALGAARAPLHHVLQHHQDAAGGDTGHAGAAPALHCAVHAKGTLCCAMLGACSAALCCAATAGWLRAGCKGLCMGHACVGPTSWQPSSLPSHLCSLGPGSRRSCRPRWTTCSKQWRPPTSSRRRWRAASRARPQSPATTRCGGQQRVAGGGGLGLVAGWDGVERSLQ